MELIIYAHPDAQSFNRAILDQVIDTLATMKKEYKVLDLYALNYDPVMKLEEMKGKASDDTARYQELVKKANNIIFIFPVWWFRAPAIMEGFIDKTFSPGFAYRFKKIIGKYGVPIPLLKEKYVLTIVTHGAPALPVKTLYLNAVKYRFLLGFLSFCFYLFRCKFLQLWAVPFVSDEKRKRYLRKVERKVSKLAG